jgi:hypothetical protein
MDTPFPDVSSLRTAIAGLESVGSGKFRTAKALLTLSESQPRRLYPFFDAFRRLLGAENNIIRWTAIRILANLAAVDTERRLEKSLTAYLAPITGPTMITAATTIAGAATIARAKPHLTGRLVDAILRVETARYQTEECRNVAIGHAITALAAIGDGAARSEAVIAFVNRQAGNSRPSTRKKAEAFLRRLARGPSASRPVSRHPRRR